MTDSVPIVVGVDGSPSADEAVRWAAVTADRRRAPLHIVAAAFVQGRSGVPIGLPPGYLEDQESERRGHLSRATTIATETASSGSLTVSTELVAGAPSHVLVEQSSSAQMVVLGARGRGEFTGGLVGSVSTAVAAHADCPVAVIREQSAEVPGGTVVVGADGTANSEPAVEEAFIEASLRGSGLVAVHAWSDFSLAALTAHNHPFHWRSVKEREEAALAQSLAGFAEDYPEVTVRHVVVKDHPVDALVSFAADAQLVVVGNRGRGGLSRTFLGSTSRALVHKTNCPTLIVRN
jgi:nucleotide-binding universal stress UspA family protein